MKSNKRKPPILKVLLEKKAIHSFSSYDLATDEHDVLLMVLITIFLEMLHETKLTQNWNILIKVLLETYSIFESNNIDRIKIKLRSVCEKYHNLKLPYKHRDKQLILEQKNRYVIARQR